MLQTECIHNARFIAFLECYKQNVFTMLDLLRSWNVTNRMYSQCYFVAFLECYKQNVFTMLDLPCSWNVTNRMYPQC